MASVDVTLATALRPTFCFLQPPTEWGDAPVYGETSGVGGVARVGETSPGDAVPTPH